jgi:hypothetical protein
MIWGGSIARRLVVVGMCCLTVLGAAPRLDCHCPDRACQVSCESGLPGSCCVATAEKEPTTPQHACCCHCNRPASQPQGDNPIARRTPCHCDMQVVRDAQLPVVRNAGHMTSPLVAWIPADDVCLVLSRPVPHGDRSLINGLPPDDPVSRAQILRL